MNIEKTEKNKFAGRVIKKAAEVIPVVLFFMVLFLSVIYLFGTEYAIIVGAFTTTFKVKSSSNFMVNSLPFLFLMQVALCFFADLANINLFLCIAVNMAVPFCLVYFQTSQFNPRGYFTSSMTFIFFQLRPSESITFLSQLEVVVFSSFVLITALLISKFLNRKTRFNYGKVGEGLSFISDTLALIARGEMDEAMKKNLFSSLNSFYNLAYKAKNEPAVSDGSAYNLYQFARLFQRVGYLVSCSFGEKTAYDEADSQRLLNLSKIVGEIEYDAGTESYRDDAVICELRKLHNYSDFSNKKLEVFYRNFVMLLILFLEKDVEIKKSEKIDIIRDKADNFFDKIKGISKSNFEFRFAIRLSLVVTVCFVFSSIYPFHHSYWLAMHAFLLLQPMYEDCNQRMKTRPVGTAVGCIIVFFVYPHLGGITGSFIFTFIMLAFMYGVKPGTGLHTAYTTCFALTLASMTMDSVTAIELRMIYLLMSIAVVMIINRFFFPTDADKLFKYNLEELIYLNFDYLELFKKFVKNKSTIYASSDKIIYFHMIYEEAKNHVLSNKSDDEIEYLKGFLYTLWRLVSEIEQMEFILQTNYITDKERSLLEDFTKKARKTLDPAKKDKPDFLSKIDVSAQLENFDLKHVLNSYVTNVGILKGFIRREIRV